MILFYLTIPLMVLAIAIAVVPLIFAMRLQHQSEQQEMQAKKGRRVADPIAA